jgi:uncharacterized protein
MEQKPTVKQGTLLFFITFLIFATVGIKLQSMSVTYGLIITEWVIVLLPVFIFIKVLGLDFRSTLRLNPLSFKEFLLSVGIGATGWLTATIFSAIVQLIFWIFGLKLPQLPIPVPQNINEFLLMAFVVSLSAAICEETLFRGFILKAFGNWGVKWSIIGSALLFAFMHGSVYRFLPILFLGITYGWVAWRTNSIYSTMITHSINNGLSLVVMTLLPAVSKSHQSQVIFGMVTLFLIIVSVVTFPILLKRLYRITSPPLLMVDAYNLDRGNKFGLLFKNWSFLLGLLIFLVLAGLELYGIITGQLS